jgi:hypothetical protein
VPGFPYVYLDATYVAVRDDALGQVVSRAVVVATGISAEGAREVLGVDIGDSEDETFWTRFLMSPATVDVHEGDTIHEHPFVNVLSPWWSSSMA